VAYGLLRYKSVCHSKFDTAFSAFNMKITIQKH